MGINIMWKFKGITMQRLRKKKSIRNYKMKMRNSRVAQHD